MVIAIVILVMWNLAVAFIAVTALLGGYRNYTEIEAIKSWYPFCEIMKIKMKEKDDSERRTE